MSAIVNDRDIQLQATSPRTASVSIASNIVVDPSNVTGLGLVIASSKYVSLASTSQLFQIPKTGSISPSSITVTATLHNLVNTPTLTIPSGGGTMSVTPSLTGGVFTFTPAQMTSDTLTLLLTVVEASITYTDTLTFVKVREGIDSINVMLTNENVTLPADYLGNVLNYGTTAGAVKVYQGINDVTSVCTFSVPSGGNPSGLTYTLVAGPSGTGGQYLITGGYPTGTDSTTLTIRTTFGSNVIDSIYTISKSKAGTNGTGSFTLLADANTSVAGNVGTKISNGTGWNAGVYSLESFIGGAIVGYTPLALNSSVVGLNSDPTTDGSYTSIDYGINPEGADDGSRSGNVYYTESGTVGPSPLTTWTLGDSFSVYYDNSNVYYAKNGTVIRTVATTANRKFYLDSSFLSVGMSGRFTFGSYGAAGQRGSQTFYVALSGSTATYSDSLATSTATAYGGPVILNDMVTQYNSSVGFSQSKFWNGTSWVVVNAVVDGNLLVSGTVGTAALSANSVTAGKIDSRGLTIKDAAGTVIFSSGTTPGNDAATTLGFNPSFTAWSGTLPDGWSTWSGAVPFKTTGISSSAPYAVEYITTASTTQGSVCGFSYPSSAPAPAGTYLTGQFSMYMITQTGSGNPGYLVRLYTNSALSTYVDNVFTIPVNNVSGWQQFPFMATANGSAIYRIDIFQIASWSGMPGGYSPAGMSIAFGPFTFNVKNPITSSNISTYISSLAVDSLQLANNSVTIPVAVTNGSAVVVNDSNYGGTYTTVSSATINTLGQPIQITGGCILLYPQGAWLADVTLWRDSTMLSTYSVFPPMKYNSTSGLNQVVNSEAPAFLIPYVDSPSSGTYTYYLKIRNTNGGNFPTTNTVKAGSTISLLGIKK